MKRNKFLEKIKEAVEPSYRACLDCDGQSRAFTYILNQEGYSFLRHVGSVKWNGENFPLHYWIEVINPEGENLIVDYKLRKWFGAGAPNGVFPKSEHKKKLRYNSSGRDSMKIPDFLYKILISNPYG